VFKVKIKPPIVTEKRELSLFPKKKGGKAKTMKDQYKCSIVLGKKE